MLAVGRVRLLRIPEHYSAGGMARRTLSDDDACVVIRQRRISTMALTRCRVRAIIQTSSDVAFAPLSRLVSPARAGWLEAP